MKRLLLVLVLLTSVPALAGGHGSHGFGSGHLGGPRFHGGGRIVIGGALAGAALTSPWWYPYYYPYYAPQVYAPPPTTYVEQAPVDAASRLARIEDLYARGVISPQEYQRLREQVLRGL